jgi:hypothetical protein
LSINLQKNLGFAARISPVHGFQQRSDRSNAGTKRRSKRGWQRLVNL